MRFGAKLYQIVTGRNINEQYMISPENGEEIENSGKKKPRGCGVVSTGAPCRIRTYDALIRSQVLYPAEVRAHA